MACSLPCVVCDICYDAAMIKSEVGEEALARNTGGGARASGPAGKGSVERDAFGSIDSPAAQPEGGSCPSPSTLILTLSACCCAFQLLMLLMPLPPTAFNTQVLSHQWHLVRKVLQARWVNFKGHLHLTHIIIIPY
jgi:hypothetical protein